MSGISLHIDASATVSTARIESIGIFASALSRRQTPSGAASVAGAFVGARTSTQLPSTFRSARNRFRKRMSDAGRF